MKRKLAILLLGGSLCACQSQYNNTIETQVEVPKTWQNSVPDVPNGSNLVQWLHDPELTQLIQTALANNQTVKIQRLELKKSHLTLERAGAVFWPELDFSFAAAKRKNNSSSEITNQISADLSASYELDVWGRLGDAKQAAQFNYQAALAELKQAELELISSVSQLWFQMLASHQLIDLSQQRLANVERNLDIIENGYQAGLNEALDVYLTRNDLESEKLNLIQQQETLAKQSRQMSLLLGAYPDDSLLTNANFPEVDFTLLNGVPTELIKQRPDVEAAWLAILTNNAALAIAHKDRFPSFKLSASLSDNQSSLSKLFSDGIAWSLSASLLQPIFDGGRLASLEKQAEIELNQAELNYLKTLYSAFEEVETGLSQFDALNRQLAYSKASRDNAVFAEKLAFEQYMKGLVTYAEVLTAQRRAFTANSQVIEIKRQIITNQVALHQALGGDFAIQIQQEQ